MNKELPAFLQWYSRAGIVPNITVVGMQGLPSGRGRKGGRPERQRKRKALSEPLPATPSSDPTFGHPPSSVLPPPLVSGNSSHVPNVNPFYCKFLGGNIRVCRGCHGSLRTADSGIPPPPFDLVIARAE